MKRSKEQVLAELKEKRKRLLRVRYKLQIKQLDALFSERPKAKVAYPVRGCGIEIQGPPEDSARLYGAPRPASTEILPENNHILNKVCKAMLKIVGLNPRADTLYSLQLADWGWEEGGLREANPKDRVPIFIVPYLLRQPPGKVMEFLFYAPGEEYCDLLKYMEQMEPGPFPPINLAIMILSQIHDRLLTEIGYYP